MRTTKAYLVLGAIAIAAILTVPAAIFVFAPSLWSQRSPTPRLTASMAADKTAYLPGEQVLLTFTVTNAGDGIATLRFGSACMAYYSVIDVDGSVVYDLRAHVACLQGFTNLTLRPGDTRAFRFIWEQVSDSGLSVPTFRYYRIRGFLQPMTPSPGTSAATTVLLMNDQTEPAEPNLAFTARTDRTVYHPGDSATVTVILTNIGIEPVVMHFGSPCFVQFLVLDETRQALYNSSKFWVCIQVLADVVLVPGESRSSVFPWNLTTDGGGPLSTGQQYQVVPSFLWANATSYQRYVSRTDVAAFTLAASPA